MAGIAVDGSWNMSDASAKEIGVQVLFAAAHEASEAVVRKLATGVQGVDARVRHPKSLCDISDGEEVC